MQRLPVYVCFLFLLSSLSAKSQSTLSDRFASHYTVQDQFLSRMYGTPLRFAYRGREAYSVTNLSYEARDMKMPVLQAKGKEQQVARFQSEGLVHVSDGLSLWGKAGYGNQLTKQVVFNETSDYDYLYPYLITDTLGGRLQGEEYSFSGAANKRMRSFNMAVAFSFRGQLEYRQLDPRPLNKVNEIDIGLGFSKKIVPGHELSLDLSFGKYKQKNTVTFLKNIGAIPVYHMVGLGHNSFRFYGDKREAFYDGYNFGVTLGYIPVASNGWHSNLTFSQDRITKLLTDLNSLPLNQLQHTALKYQLGYLNSDNTQAKGMDLTASIHRSMGEEGVFAGAGQNSYEKLGDRETYGRDNILLGMSAFYEQKKYSGWSHSWSPALVYRQDSEKYMPLEHRKNSRSWQATMLHRVVKKRAKDIFHLSSSLGYRSVLAAYMDLPDMADDHMYRAMLEHDFSAYRSSFVQYGVNPSWDRQLTTRYMIGVHIKIEAIHYLAPRNRVLWGQVGASLKL